MVSASAGEASIPNQWFRYDSTREVPLYRHFLSLKELGFLGFARAALKMRRERRKIAVHLNHAATAFIARLLIGRGPCYALSLHRDLRQETRRNRFMLDVVTRLGVDALVANSGHTLSSVPEVMRARQPCQVIYNGVDERGLARIAAEFAPGQRDGTVRLIYIGRLEAIKNPAGAIRIAGLLANRRPVSLEIIGGGTENATLRSLSARAACPVELRGPLPHADAMRALLASDAVLIPSLSEGYCNVAAEAMALGRRIVYNAIPTLVEVIGDHGLAIDYAHPDVEAIAAYIRSELQVRSTVGTHGFRAALDAFAAALKSRKGLA